MEQAIITTVLGTALAGAAYGLKEWWRLATLREKMAAVSLVSWGVQGVVLVAFAVCVWFIISPAAAVATLLVWPTLAVGKHIAAFMQHLLYLWWERHLRYGIQRHVCPPNPSLHQDVEGDRDRHCGDER